jgi:hypothetical protein
MQHIVQFALRSFGLSCALQRTSTGAPSSTISSRVIWPRGHSRTQMPHPVHF